MIFFTLVIYAYTNFMYEIFAVSQRTIIYQSNLPNEKSIPWPWSGLLGRSTTIRSIGRLDFVGDRQRKASIRWNERFPGVGDSNLNLYSCIELPVVPGSSSGSTNTVIHRGWHVSSHRTFPLIHRDVYASRFKATSTRRSNVSRLLWDFLMNVFRTITNHSSWINIEVTVFPYMTIETIRQSRVAFSTPNWTLSMIFE